MTSASLQRPLARVSPGQAVRTLPLIVAGLVAGLFAAALVVAAVATSLFDYQILTVRSESMAPAIKAGDVIVVRPRAINAESPGDIVLFASGGDRIPTVHRVAGINEVELRVSDRQTGAVRVFTEHRLVTKGDSNEMPDIGEVTGDEFLGEVWFTLPWGSWFTLLPLQYVFLAIAACACLAWLEWERRHRTRRSDR